MFLVFKGGNQMNPNENKPSEKNRNKGLAIVIRVMIWLIIIGVTSGFFVLGFGAGYMAYLVKDDKIRSEAFIREKLSENNLTSFAYFRDGTTIQLRSDEDRRPVKLSEVPEDLINAFFAIEDNAFREHQGINLKAFTRAVLQRITDSDVQTGGSTITQQLARNVFLSLDKEDSRKAKEIFLSLRLERILSKDQILTAYLNEIPFGQGANGYNLYGVQAAAKGMFDLPVSEINLPQAAFLAGLPQRPSDYSSFRQGKFYEEGFEKAKKRQELVLRRMLEENKISQQQYDEALAFDIKASLRKPEARAYNEYPFLMIEIERQAAEALLMVQNPELTPKDLRDPKNAALIEGARKQILSNGYKIQTTIDKNVYDIMRGIASNPKNFTPDDVRNALEQVGAVMIDNKTGAILGLMEGRDFSVEQLNHATQAIRQPGSAMKPIAAYAPAIEKGYIQPGGVIDDAPIMLPDGTKGVHLPKNWNNKYSGLMTARHALNQSFNIPAIKLFLQIGIKEAWGYTRQMGITTLVESDDYAQTGVIGGLAYGTSVAELAGAYTTFANGGIYRGVYMIESIRDTNNEIIYEYKQEPEIVFSEQTAYLVTDMLKTVVTDGTAKSIKSQLKNFNAYEIAGKTGTTSENTDVWFVGYTPDITLGVWVGYDLQKNKLTRSGAGRAKEIWAKTLNEVFAQKPEISPKGNKFTRPPGIISGQVCNTSGKLPTELCRESGRVITDIFNKEDYPTEEDDALVKASIVSFEGKTYLAQENTPADMTEQKVLFKRPLPGDPFPYDLAAIEAVPESKREPLSYYIPQDADLELPKETDPRQDDGSSPAPPSGLILSKQDSIITISFTPSPSPDVVGYRLYRSEGGGSFTLVNGNVVLQQQDKLFTDSVNPDGRYAYYIRAVDVAGNESAQSQITASNGAYVPPGNSGDFLFPGLFPGGTGNPDGNEDGGTNGGTGEPATGTDPERSDEINANTDDNTGQKDKAPSTPSGFSVNGTPMGVELRWSANPNGENVEKYNIYYSTSENGSYERIGTTNITRFNYLSVPSEGWYRITAVNKQGESKPTKSLEYKME